MTEQMAKSISLTRSLAAILILLMMTACQLSEEEIAARNLDLIVTSLRGIQSEGGEGNFAVFDLENGRNYYIQFSGSPGESQLYAEAVSNEFLSSNAILTANQMAQLQSLGWNSPDPNVSPNFYRTWVAENDNQRTTIGLHILEAFEQVYGMQPGDSLSVEMTLD